MVWFRLEAFRRFESAKLNVDAPVVALVGPNEAGKTSLLRALIELGHSRPFDPRDITRGSTVSSRGLEATYLLEADDREALAAREPAASGIRWYRIWRDADGSQSHETIPMLWNRDEADRADQYLAELRSLDWVQATSQEVAGLVHEAVSTLPAEPASYTEEQLSDLAELSREMLADSESPPSSQVQQVFRQISRVVESEKQRRSHELALSVLRQRTPKVLEFSESDRTLHSEYNLQEHGTWTGGVSNLARLGEIDLDELSQLAAGSQPELLEELLVKANERLAHKFATLWSQSDVVVRLNVAPPHRLLVFVAAGEGAMYRIEDRSAGLRTFVALVAFLSQTNMNVLPILVVDEAENHLHWDAQADLVNLFHTQDVASQIIYSTHSPGCLPHDLGHGVRAIVPYDGQPDRSKVRNWIWKSDAGFRPLLLDMGASHAALTPYRFAVVTEGVADFILLPSLLREATGNDSLPYQIVPGLAQLTRSGIHRISSESDAVVFLTDGDAAGKNISRRVHAAGIPANQILTLPAGTVLEDLVASETLETAVKEELRRSGHEVIEKIKFPDSGRAAYLDAWYDKNSIPRPSKRAIACRALEIAAGSPTELGLPLLEGKHTSELSNLHESLLRALNG